MGINDDLREHTEVKWHHELKWRPQSYTDFPDPLALALNGIQGQRRREMIRDILTREVTDDRSFDEYAGLGDEVVNELLFGSIQQDILEERAPKSFIDTMSGAHSPCWMGGEFLPDFMPGEIEIARIILESTLLDVISVRARWRSGRYRYRVVDEHITEFAIRRKTSHLPLTLQELINLLEQGDVVDHVFPGSAGTGLVRHWWHQQLSDGVYDAEECPGFTSVESDQYPSLALWYKKHSEEWITEYADEEEEWV